MAEIINRFKIDENNYLLCWNIDRGKYLPATQEQMEEWCSAELNEWNQPPRIFTPSESYKNIR